MATREDRKTGSGSMLAPLVRALFQVGVYKGKQGRVTRQVTCATLWLAVAIGCWRLTVVAITSGPAIRFGLPAVLLAAGLWISYRMVNLPQFADFLIAVEAEMNKVSWPTRHELWRASVVVMLLIFSMAAILFLYDLFWKTLLTQLGVLGG